MADSADDLNELLVMLANASLQIVEAGGKLAVGGEDLSKAHEGAHDFDIDPNRPLAFENAGEHSDALFGKGERKLAPSTVSG